MGQKKVKIILKKVSKEDDKGYLRVSVRENNKTSLISIPLPPIELKYWNGDKQVVKSTFPKYKMYNEKIEETLEEIRLKKNEEDGVAPSKIMFLESCKNLIENNYQKHSTKIRYHFYIISFENFILNRFKTKDIPISFLTTKFFEDYIKHESSKKTFSQNNINLSISAIKSFLRKIEKTKDIQLPNNFYEKISSLKSVARKKKILPLDNFKKILQTKMDDPKLENVRQIFLFQVFSNGLRFSDVSTLRYKDFNVDSIKEMPEIRFLKYQRKTRKPINTLVNFRSIKILANFVPKDTLSMEDLQKLEYFIQSDTVQNKTSNNSQSLDDLKETLKVKLDNDIISRYFFTPEISVCASELIPMKENYVKALTEKYRNEGLDDVTIDVLITNNEHLKYFDDLIGLVRKKAKQQFENKIHNEERLNLEFYKIIAKILLECKEKRPLDFVFPLLKNEDFMDIITDDGFSLVDFEQQNILQRTTVFFNINLSKICNILKISKITSHYARNSFGSLLLAIKGDKSVDLYSLMNALGHANIKQTVDYIQSLSNEGKDDLTKSLSDRI
jgi:integrase